MLQRQTRENYQQKATTCADVTHCSFDLPAQVTRLPRRSTLTHARANWRYHFMYPVRLGAGLAGPFSRQPLILAYLIAGFSLVHSASAGSSPGIDQRHLRAWPDLHAVIVGLEIDLKDRAGRQGDPVRRGRATPGRLPARYPVLCGDRPLDGRQQLRRALSLRRLRAVEHGHHRESAVRETRELDTLPGRITLGVLVLQGYLCHPVPGGAAESG